MKTEQEQEPKAYSIGGFSFGECWGIPARWSREKRHGIHEHEINKAILLDWISNENQHEK